MLNHSLPTLSTASRSDPSSKGPAILIGSLLAIGLFANHEDLKRRELRLRQTEAELRQNEAEAQFAAHRAVESDERERDYCREFVSRNWAAENQSRGWHVGACADRQSSVRRYLRGEQ